MKRVLMVVLVLAAMPFLAAVSQNLGQAATDVSAAGRCATADASRSATAGQNGSQPVDPKGRDRTGCSPAAPAPAASCSAAFTGTGSLSITGTTQLGVSPFTALPGWCIQLSGTVTAAVLTDGSGNYTFSGLPSGTYTVCEVVQSGWTETFPQSSWGTACPTGYGWSFGLDGFSAAYVNFMNTSP